MLKMLLAMLFASTLVTGAAWVAKYHGSNSHYTRTHAHYSGCGHKGTPPRPSNPVPEPSAALLFGAGALTVAAVSRRRRTS